MPPLFYVKQLWQQERPFLGLVSFQIFHPSLCTIYFMLLVMNLGPRFCVFSFQGSLLCILHFWVEFFVWILILKFFFSCSLARWFPLFIYLLNLVGWGILYIFKNLTSQVVKLILTWKPKDSHFVISTSLIIDIVSFVVQFKIIIIAHAIDISQVLKKNHHNYYALRIMVLWVRHKSFVESFGFKFQ